MTCACVFVLGAMTAIPIDASVLPDLLSISSASYHFDPADGSPPLSAEPSVTQDDLATAAQSRPEHRPFGLADTRSWLINGGVASDFNETTAGRAGLGVSYFVADDVSFDAELNFMYFNQKMHDALGVNLDLIVRWHAWHDQARTWSIYFDGGVGMMVSDEDVPDMGSRFSFTPQLGAGMSFRIANDARLYVGTRWHHVSNANIFESNPGHNTELFYAMIGFPF